MLWEDDPPAGAGCELGDRHPGWRVVVQAAYNADQSAALYGSGTYGGGVFGDANGAGLIEWQDITPPVFAVDSYRGAVTPDYIVPVSEMTASVVDLAGESFGLTNVGTFEARVGTLSRVGVIAPDSSWHPLQTGRIESILDEHDAPPRLVAVTAFGLLSDLVAAVPNFDRPFAEPAADRIDWLLSQAGWDWKARSVPASDDPGWQLLATEDVAPVEARAMLDRTAISAGWYLTEAADGGLEFLRWPTESRGTTIVISDCPDPFDADALQPESVTLVEDLGEHLNTVAIQNTANSQARAYEFQSLGRYGQRGNAIGFPLAGVDTPDDELQGFADRVRDRFGKISRRCVEVTVDSWVDDRWLAVLADLQIGQPFTLRRLALGDTEFLVLDMLLVGVRNVIEPDRWRAVLYLTTTRET